MLCSPKHKGTAPCDCPAGALHGLGGDRARQEEHEHPRGDGHCQDVVPAFVPAAIMCMPLPHTQGTDCNAGSLELVCVKHMQGNKQNIVQA